MADERERTHKGFTVVSPTSPSIWQSSAGGGLDWKCASLRAEEPELAARSSELPSEVICCTITNNERYCALGITNGEIVLLDIEEDMRNYLLEGHYEEAKCLCASNDSKFIVSGSYDRKIIIWRLSDRSIENVLAGHEDKILGICMSKDDKWIVSTGLDKQIIIWSKRRVEVKEKFSLKKVVAYSVGITSDKSKLILGCSDFSILVWSVAENASLGRCVGHEMPVSSLCVFSDDRRVVSCSSDNTVKVWDTNTFELLGELDRREETVYSVSLSCDDKYVVFGDFEGHVSIADTSVYNGNNVVSWKLHDAPINCVKVSASGKYVLTGSSDRLCKLFNLSESPSETVLRSHDSPVNDLLFTQDRQLLVTASDDNNILAWRVGSSDYEYQLDGHTEPVNCLALAYNRQLCVSGSNDSTIRVWNITEESEVQCLRGHNDSVKALCIPESEDYIISGSSKIIVWDFETFESLACLDGSGSVMSICASPQYFFSGGISREITMWNFGDFSEEHIFKGHKETVSSLAVLRSESTLISAGHDGTIRYWDYEERGCVSILRCAEKTITRIVLTADDTYMLSISNSSIVNLWSVDSRVVLGTLFERKTVYACGISADKRYLAIGSESNVILAKSPLIENEKKSHWVIPYKYSIIFRKLVYNLMNHGKRIIDPAYVNYIFVPWNINLLHILSYMNYWKALQQAIYDGTKFLRSSVGETPLTIALNRKSKVCAGVIIQSFPDYLIKSHPESIEFITDDLRRLNKSSLHSLNLLYDCLFQKVKDQNVPTYGTFVSKPPVILLHTHHEIKPKMFLIPKTEEKDSLRETEVEFRQSLIKLNLNLGSEDSIAFFKSLSQCNNMEVFNTDFIKTLLQFKWRQIQWLIWMQTLIYLLLLIILLYYSLNDIEDLVSLVILVLINTIFLIYEFIQLLGELSSYIRSSMNMLDMSRILLLYIYAICVATEVEKEILIVLLAMLVILSWIRFVAYIRMFEGTRYLIRMIIEVLKDMGPFFLIFVTSTIAFCVGFNVADEEDVRSFSDNLLIVYKFAFADFGETDEYSELEIILFVMASLINTLILFNMLIAIMSDTFSRVRQSLVVFDRKEMTEIILEIDSICFWGRKRGMRKYIQQCKKPETKLKIKEKVRDALTGKVEELERVTNVMNGKIDGIAFSIKGLEDRVKENSSRDIMDKVKEVIKEVDVLKDQFRKKAAGKKAFDWD